MYRKTIIRKEKAMSGMTQEQFRIAISMIITIVESADTKEDAIRKIKALLDKNEKS